MRTRTSSLLALLVVAGAVPAARAEGPEGPSRTSARLVPFDELQNRLGAPGLRLLDARPRDEYDKGHIPGAVWLDAKAAATLAARPGGLEDEEAWEAWTAPLGIDFGDEVLVYDASRQKEAARFWWLLRYLGVESVGLLNGGFPLWVEQGRPVSTDVPEVDPRPFEVTFQRDRHATRSEVLAALDDDRARVVDARSAEEHTGERKRSAKGGHIPGACLLEWSDFVDEQGRFLDDDALRAKVTAAGVKPGERVITHCQGGGRASVDAFVFERLGFPTRNYYLGWSDWGNAEETPVEGGEANDGSP